MADLLRVLRTRAGLSVIQAAERIGVARTTIYMWESGDKTPEPDSLRRAAEVYGATEQERVALAISLAYGVDPAPVGA